MYADYNHYYLYDFYQIRLLYLHLNYVFPLKEKNQKRCNFICFENLLLFFLLKSNGINVNQLRNIITQIYDICILFIILLFVYITRNHQFMCKKK